MKKTVEQGSAFPDNTAMRKTLLALMLLAALISCDSSTDGGPSRPSVPGTSTSESTAVAEDMTYYMEEDLPSSYDFTDSAYTVEDGVVTITDDSGENLRYTISGETLDGITVTTESAVELVLDNVTVEATSSPALTLEGDGTVFIKLIGDSSLSSTKKKGISGDMCSVVIYSEDGGSLSVTAYKKDAINLDGGRLRVLSGTLSVTVPESAESGDGIDVFAYVQDGGDVTVEALCSEHDEESKGIKAKGDDDSSAYPDPMGYIAINGGTLSITSYGKALTANWDYSEDGDGELDGANGTDPAASLYINGGTITITTIGEPVEEGSYAADSSYSLSPEGMEGKQNLVINGGTIEITATDDAVNAGSSLIINGGSLYAESSANDALDTNGTLEINGGTIVAIGSAAPETGIDSDSDRNFTYTGGTVVALGGESNNTPSSSSTTGKAVTCTASSTMAITTSSGDPVIAYTLPSSSLSGYNVLFCSSDLATGSYVYTTGAEITAGDDFHGLALGDFTLSGGKSSSFRISSTVTSVKSGRSQD